MMGLDITHDRATLDKTSTFVNSEDFYYPGVPFECFAAYAQDIEHDKISEHIILISSGLRKHLSKAGFHGARGKRNDSAKALPHHHLKPYGPARYVTLTQDEDLESRMAAFEREYLDGLAKAKSRVVKFSEKIIEVPGRGRYGILSFGKHLVVRGFYSEQLGYQRKGVLPDFWGIFQESGAICRRAEAESMLKTIQPELRQHFKTHFVDNFVEGASLISWTG